MAIALVYPATHEADAKSVEGKLARFAPVDLFALGERETVVDVFAEAKASDQVLFLLTAGVTPPAARGEWRGILEHLEQRRDPPLAFHLLEPVAVPAAVRRALCGDGLRGVDAWAASHCQLPGHVPAALPWFTGREQELEDLFQALVDRPGVLTLTGPALCGKSSLAQHFARLAGPCFQSVEWIMDGRTLPASAIGTRSLYVVDEAPEPYVIPAGNSSVLLTAREWHSGPTLALSPVALPELPDEPDLAALALLRRNGFHRLAADMPIERLTALAEARLLDRIDAAGDWYRLPWPVAPDESWRPRWARAVYYGLLQPQDRHAWLPESLPAYLWAAQHDWPLAVELGRRAARKLEEEGRQAQAAHLWRLLEMDAEAHGQPALAKEAASARAWIVNEHSGAYLDIEPGEQLSLFT